MNGAKYVILHIGAGLRLERRRWLERFLGIIVITTLLEQRAERIFKDFVRDATICATKSCK
jgi:hypothetical protein